MQLAINGTYGMIMSIGLFLVGVEYALLWGFLAAALRYIPYIGAWIAAVPPIILSVAMDKGWVQPLMVVGLVILMELITSNVIEPWLYGQSFGRVGSRAARRRGFLDISLGADRVGSFEPINGLFGRAGKVRSAIGVL